MGSRAYKIAKEAPLRGESVILEVGSERGEGSTQYLSNLGPRLYSIDVDPEIYSVVKDKENVIALLGRAEDVLASWDSITDAASICFAWLDGHDWPYPDFAPEYMRDQYEMRGQTFTQEASAASHELIASLIYSRIPPGGIIAIDDTWPIRGGYDGKGRTAIPLLLRNRFRILQQPYHLCVAVRKR